MCADIQREAASVGLRSRLQNISIQLRSEVLDRNRIRPQQEEGKSVT